MAAGNWTLTNEGRSRLIDGTFALSVNACKMALFLSTSNIGSASTTYAGLTNEVANAFGYTTGGTSVTISLSGTTTVTINSTTATWTASGGSLVARFVVLYNVGGHVIAYALLDSTPADVTVTTGNSLSVQEGVNGVMQLS
jgi:hypothetical protein